VFVLGKPFRPSLIIVGKARSLALSRAPGGGFTQVGFGLARKQYARLDRFDVYDEKSYYTVV
jgi:hypothetical protein